MSKLLRGQQLFISKHIHNQVLHEETPSPPDPRPPTDFIPCISTYSNGGQLMAIYELGLSQVGAVNWFYRAHNLTTDSFTFPNILHPKYPAKIGNYPMRYFVNLDAPVKNYTELQRRHKAHFHLTAWVRLQNASHPPYSIWWAKIQAGLGGTSLKGDTTYASGNQQWYGSWGIAYTLQLPQPNNPRYILAHDHPIDTIITWFQFNQLGDPLFSCEKSILGIHRTLLLDPNVTLI